MLIMEQNSINNMITTLGSMKRPTDAVTINDLVEVAYKQNGKNFEDKIIIELDIQQFLRNTHILTGQQVIDELKTQMKSCAFHLKFDRKGMTDGKFKMNNASYVAKLRGVPELADEFSIEGKNEYYGNKANFKANAKRYNTFKEKIDTITNPNALYDFRLDYENDFFDNQVHSTKLDVQSFVSVTQL